MSNNHVRIPLHMHPDVVKSIKSTDFAPTEARSAYVIPEGVHSSFRTPPDRVSGNEMFRRYPDGTLDMEAAVADMMELLTKVRMKGPLTDLEQLALSAVYPSVFKYISAGPVLESMRISKLRISPMESMAIGIKLGAKIREQLNYNAGHGGGSVPGRDVTFG